jgi:hypothetical protein
MCFTWGKKVKKGKNGKRRKRRKYENQRNSDQKELMSRKVLQGIPRAHHLKGKWKRRKMKNSK